MKKKYITVAVTGLMCILAMMTACGKEADRSEKDEEDDDKDVYVEMIDEDDLEDQIEVIADHMDEWLIDTDAADDIYSTSYCVTDLDHNGRAEILTFAGLGSTYTLTEIHVYEVDEKGKGLNEAKWKVTGLAMGDGYPDPTEPFEVSVYYEEKEGTAHYAMCDSFFAGDDYGGMVFCELTYSDGKVKCNNYAAMAITEDYTPEYITDDGTEIEDDLDFSEYIKEYTSGKHGQDSVSFGLFLRKGSAIDDITSLDDEDLAEMLTDSYLVFADEYDVDDFDMEYNPDTAGYVVDHDDDIYGKILGEWYLSYADLGGQIEHYDGEYGPFMILCFFDDESALVTEYADGDQTMRMNAAVDFDDDGNPFFIYDDPDGLTEQIDYEIYTVTKLSRDEKELTVVLDFYDNDTGLLGGYTLYFAR